MTTTTEGPTVCYRWRDRVIPAVWLTRAQTRVAEALATCADQNGRYAGGFAKLMAESGASRHVVSDALTAASFARSTTGSAHSGSTTPFTSGRPARTILPVTNPYADREPISNAHLALRCSSWRLGDNKLDPRLIFDRLAPQQMEFVRSEIRKDEFSPKCRAVREWRDGPPGALPPPGIGLYVWTADDPACLLDDAGGTSTPPVS